MTELQAVFASFESNQEMDFHELSPCLRQLGFAATDALAHEMMQEADMDQNGKISFREFCNMITRQQASIPLLD